MELARWIVVGTDFSDGAQYALEHAVKLADKIGARVAVVHAYEEQAHSLSSAETAATEALRDQLACALARTGAMSDPLRVDMFIRRGAPWEKILNVAVEVGADLIVVGATGQRGASAAGCALGSVAYRVVSASTRSVLISHGTRRAT
jgi:nucleotide-binding universal stress UspA family protein